MDKIKQYFDIKEVVCKHVFNKFGEGAWQFFDPRLLETMVVIREKLGKPIYVNNWDMGGNLTQRGLRCCVCQLVKDKARNNIPYLSDHVLCRGIDFDVKGMSAQEVRDWLEKNKNELPYKIRVEKDVNWVHIGVGYFSQKEKILYFCG